MLLKKTSVFVAIAATLVIATSQTLRAELPRINGPKLIPTVVTIEGEMCGGCVKKITAALAEVPGVAKVAGDTKAETITIVHSPKASLSSRAVWVAIEKTGKKPVKLVGPRGTFKSKPAI